MCPAAPPAVILISIHAAREGGDENKRSGVYKVGISIHAAREGGDQRKSSSYQRNYISIHAAREGGDANFRLVRIAYMDFNPRRP